MSREEAVLLKKEGAIAEVILNRPESMNAMNRDLIEGLFRRFEELEGEKSARVVVVRGNGPCFCAGGDIKFFKSNLEASTPVPEEMPDRLHEVIEQIRRIRVPVIASIHGSAAGAGTSLALACDLAISSEEAKFNLAYCRIGLSPDGGSTYFLPRHVGLKKATEIFLTGGTLTAKEARDLGLINLVVPIGDLASETARLAQRLADGPTEALGRAKRLLNESEHNTLRQQLALETRLIAESSRTADFREGITSFLEKRGPKFAGR